VLRLLVAFAALASALGARGAPLSFEVGGARLGGRVASFRELRDHAVVKQAHDFSCGAAALATLLQHGLGELVTEEELLARVFRDASDAEERLLRNRGLSVLDMQKLARERGLKAQGFRLAAEQLARIRRPILVFIRPLGYEHFAVLKGIRAGRAYLADPSQGNASLPLDRFLDMWRDDSGQGIAFVAERADGAWPAQSPLYLDAGAWPAPAPATGWEPGASRPGSLAELPGRRP